MTQPLSKSGPVMAGFDSLRPFIDNRSRLPEAGWGILGRALLANG